MPNMAHAKSPSHENFDDAAAAGFIGSDCDIMRSFNWISVVDEI